MGVLVATKAALDRIKCECCDKPLLFKIPAGTTGIWELGKNKWQERGNYPTPVFINSTNNRAMHMDWGYNILGTNLTPTKLQVNIGVGTTQFDIYVII